MIIKGHPASIKSDEARAWMEKALVALDKVAPIDPIDGEIAMHAVIIYASQRPDLDDTLLCDTLQKAGIIVNDRQIREKHLWHAIDKERPRVHVALTRRTAYEG